MAHCVLHECDLVGKLPSGPVWNRWPGPGEVGERERDKVCLAVTCLPPGTEGQVDSSMEISTLKCLSPWEQSTPRESMEVERPGDTKQTWFLMVSLPLKKKYNLSLLWQSRWVVMPSYREGN